MARGNAYDDLGDSERAIKDYGRAIELRPEFAPAYLNRAVAYYRNAAYDKALADVKTCKELGRNLIPPEMRSQLSELEALLKAPGSARPEGAKPQADAALAQAPHDPAVNQLITAAKKGDVQRLDELLASGVEADATAENGDRALNVAAGKGHVEVVRKLLKAGADPNKRDENGFTVLFLVAGGRGSPEIVRVLLDHGADPNIAGTGGAAPLHRTAIHGNLEVAKLLIEAGADPSQEVTHPELAAIEGKNAIYIALQKSHVDVAQYLADSGAELDIWTASAVGQTERIKEILDRKPWLLAAPGRYQFRPLHFAAAYGQPEAAEVLLKRGADPNVREGRGRSTALHLAARFGYDKVAAVLLEHGADPNAIDASGVTPMDVARGQHRARESNGTVADRQGFIELLEEHGAE